MAAVNGVVTEVEGRFDGAQLLEVGEEELAESTGLIVPGVAGRKGMGWLRDHPSLRDYTLGHDSVGALLQSTSVPRAPALPRHVDLREWCSPIEDQGQLGSCTAH